MMMKSDGFPNDTKRASSSYLNVSTELNLQFLEENIACPYWHHLGVPFDLFLHHS